MKAGRKSGKPRGNGPRNQKGGRGALQLGVPHPPQIDGLELRHSLTLRFKVIAGVVNQNITFQNLLDAFLVATAAAAGVQVFQTVKVRRVRAWGIAAIGAAPSTVVVEFSGVTVGITGDQAIHSDTAIGVDPAFVQARPNQKALASDYQLSSAAVAFTLSVPAGAVVDVDLSYRGQFAAATALQNALVGATPGAFYLRGLDGLAIAGTNFAPEFFGGAQ